MSDGIWQLTDLGFSRIWRRNKDYRIGDIRYLAHRQGCSVKLDRNVLTVFDRSKNAVAHFQRVRSPEDSKPLPTPQVNERLRLFASLKA